MSIKSTLMDSSILLITTIKFYKKTGKIKASEQEREAKNLI